MFLLSVLFLFPEIETGINSECAERIGYGQVGLAIIVRMYYHRGTHEVFGIVIHDAGSGNQVEVDVLCPVFILEILVVYLRFLVSDAWKQ